MAFTLQLAVVPLTSYAATVTEALPGMTKSITTPVRVLGSLPLLAPKISKPVPTRLLPEGQLAVTCSGDAEFSELEASTLCKPFN
jgi:hypothetical protein